MDFEYPPIGRVSGGLFPLVPRGQKTSARMIGFWTCDKTRAILPSDTRSGAAVGAHRLAARLPSSLVARNEFMFRITEVREQ